MELECEIRDIFEAISKEERIKFKINEEYFQKTQIELPNEKSEWCNVSALITKCDSIQEIKWSNNLVSKCASDHILHCGAGYTRFAKDFHPGDEIILANGVSAICMSNMTSEDEETVYDLQIDTPSHLYQTSGGIIHHNTLIAQSIARQLNVPFAIADATSLTESGLKYRPLHIVKYVE